MILAGILPESNNSQRHEVVLAGKAVQRIARKNTKKIQNCFSQIKQIAQD
jgi:hypothetical protein